MTKFKVSQAHYMEQGQKYNVMVMGYPILVNFKSQQVQSHTALKWGETSGSLEVGGKPQKLNMTGCFENENE